MGLVFIPQYIKYLGIESYGLIGLHAILQSWLGLLDMGMTPTLGREMARYSGNGRSTESIWDLLRTIEISALCVALIVVGVIACSSGWIATSWLKTCSLPNSVVSQALIMMGLVTALRFVEGVYRSSMIGLQRQVLFNSLTSLIATLRGIGAVGVLLYVAPTIMVFFIWQSIVSLISIIIFAYITYRIVPRGNRKPIFSIHELKAMWRFTASLWGIAISAFVLKNLDKIILSKILTLTQFAYYCLVCTLAGFLSLLATPIINAFYPHFCKLLAQSAKDKFIESYHKCAQLISSTIGTAAIVLIINSKIILALWTKNTALANESATLLSLYAIGTLINILMWTPYHAQLAYGSTSLALIINVLAVIFLVPMLLWIVPNYGAISAAIIWIFINLSYYIANSLLMNKNILQKEALTWHLNDVFYPVFSGFLAVFTIQKILPSNSEQISSVIMLTASTLIGLSISIMMCKDLKPILFNSIKYKSLKYICK